MDFIQDILDKSPHNAKAYTISKHGILFDRPGGRSKVGQFYSSPIAYFESGEWQGFDAKLKEVGGFNSGKGSPFKILPTGEIHWGGVYRHLVESVGYYEIATDKYQHAVSLPKTGLVTENIHRKEMGLYRYDTIHQGLSVKGELTILEKPENMSGDLFVISAKVWGAQLPLGKFKEDGFEHVENGKRLRIFGGGIAMDARGVPIPVQMYVVDMPPPVFRQLLIGVPVSWLDTAAEYPVTIDPTISPKTSSNDATITGTDPSSWGTARSTSSSYSNSATELGSGNAGYAGGDPKVIWRGYAVFDTSAITGGVEAIQGVTITGKLKTRGDTSLVAPYVVDADWEEPVSGANREANYDLALSSSKIIEWVDSDTATTVGSVYTSPDFGDYSAINPDGDTRLALVSSQDYDNVGLSSYGIIRYLNWYSGDHATAGDRVYLTVEYMDQPYPTAIVLKTGLHEPKIGLYDTRVKLRSKRRDVALSTIVRNDQ